MKHYYRRLSVSLVASPDDINRTYHREARRTHPDSGGSRAAQQRELAKPISVPPMLGQHRSLLFDGPVWIMRCSDGDSKLHIYPYGSRSWNCNSPSGIGLSACFRTESAF